MKIKVHTKKPVKIDGESYAQGEHLISDSLAHSAELKALFKKDACTVLPRNDHECRLQKSADDHAAQSAVSQRKSAKKE